MGRGRQKAKQTKVARALKYHSAEIDVTALQRELAAGQDEQDYGIGNHGDDEDPGDDPYAVYADDGGEANDYASPASGR